MTDGTNESPREPDDPRADYERLRAEHGELFRNLPGGIDILPADTAEAAQALAAVGQSELGVVYRDPYLMIVRDPVRFPDGTLGTYVRLLGTTNGAGTVVLPLLGDGRVALVEHFRHATRAWHLEVPRGFAAPGLSSEENAVKELAEEIGATPDELIPLGRLHPDTGLLADHVDLYAARISGTGAVDVHEGVRRVLPVSFTEAEDHVRTGRITDGFTIAVLSRARLAGLAD